MNGTSRRVGVSAYPNILLYVDDDLLHAAKQQNNRITGKNHAPAALSSSAMQLSAVLHSWSAAREYVQDCPSCEPLQRRFEVMARTTPSAVAVTFNGRCLTYGELDEQADALALHLQTSGLAAGSFCMIDLAPSLARVRAVLATLKAGAACLHVDGRVRDDAAAAVMTVVNPALCFTRRASPGRAPDHAAAHAMRTIFCGEEALDLPYGWADELPVSARTPACAFASVSSTGDLCISVRTHQAMGASMDCAREAEDMPGANIDPGGLWLSLSRGAPVTIPA